MLSQLGALCRGLRNSRVRHFVSVFAAGALGAAYFAQVAAAGDVAKSDGTPVNPKTWTGFGWGLGIAADFDVGGKRVVDATVTPNGILRVTDSSSNVGVSFVLEAHYFAFEWQTGRQSWCKNPNLHFNCNDIATGPFVAVEIGGGTAANTDAGPITGYALGWMVGLHHPDAPSTSSWNFGVGLRVDPKAKVLGDGLVANQPIPPGDQFRTKTEPRYGIMLLSSFSF
ncbi:MAG TPA: hypothetical protein VFN27_04325 [Xanthobacteraceae bacterium]|nr:hypothetical protein [Xanthobacteraceae bacterium]